MPKYTLHQIAVNEHNTEGGYAMRNPDGEAFDLYGLEDLRAVYEMLKAYFEQGEISPETVEREELDSSYVQSWQAVRLARDYGAPATLSDAQLEERIRSAAQRGRIQGAHMALDGLDWWYPRRALENYFFGRRWGERAPIPATDKPTITLQDEPWGNSGQTLADALADGAEIAHKDKETGIWYLLYLGENDQIIGVADETSVSATRPAALSPKENRVKVEAGRYKIGDYIGERQITGFGKVWAEGTLSAGQLWQPCRLSECGREPVCVQCQRCSRHCGCDTAEYQYAYFV